MSEVGISTYLPIGEIDVPPETTSPTDTVEPAHHMTDPRSIAVINPEGVNQKMDPVFKTLWLEALRSGKFGQIDGYLGREEEDGTVAGYCCLGVLCEIAKARSEFSGTFEITRASNYEGHFVFGAQGNLDHGLPPAPIATWAGITRDPAIPISAIHALQARDESAPRVGADDSPEKYTTLSVLNDRGFTFAHIAALIEECL